MLHVIVRVLIVTALGVTAPSVAQADADPPGRASTCKASTSRAIERLARPAMVVSIRCRDVTGDGRAEA